SPMAVYRISDDVSIHAAWVGGDQDWAERLVYQVSFNPRRLGRRRRSFLLASQYHAVFQSTPPG
ncbi:MAG: hypothetical protein NTW32_26680, partial [Chloroflexi bacterium]|nr:hypothetical protein [Chloroflexota bacterium]